MAAVQLAMASPRAIDLPEDIVIDILSRLPVKSLMRFKSVCKYWRHLFRNQSFIDKFQTLNSNTNKTTVIVKHADEVKGDYCFSILSDASGADDEITTVVSTMFAPLIEGFKSSRTIGSVNGLLCLYYYDDDDDPYFYYYGDDDVEYARDLFVVWNPAIREFKRVPFPPIKPLFGARKTRTSNVGFGFDMKTNDYKIIRFVRNLFHNNVQCREQVQLYSLNNNSWEEISFLYDISVIIEPKSTRCLTPYMNGVYYWWAVSLDTRHEESMILSFDFANQVFETLHVDNYTVSRFPSKSSELTICDGLLSFVEIDYTHSIYDYEKFCTMVVLWAMNERGVNESWKELWDLDIEGHYVSVIIWKHYLFLNDDAEQLLLYDIYTGQFRNLQLHGYNLQVVNYAESLVPIP